MNDTILIAGGGLTGLSIAYELQQRGIPYLLMEAGPEAGGVVQSVQQDGFTLDVGPNSIGATPATLAFLKEIGLEHEVMEAGAAGKNRFLVRYNQLHAVSPHPGKIISSPYLSRAAKWRLFTERFRKPQPAAGDESVSSFVQRRFNQEICDYLFDPILSGIYAGDPARLSVNETLPFLPRWEREYGSVTKGLMKNKGVMGGRKIITMKGGNTTLVNRLQELLTTPVRFNCRVTGVVQAAEGYMVQYNENGQTQYMNVNRVLFTTPAYATATALHELAPVAAQVLQEVYYPRMGVLHLGFEKSAIANFPDGFGFLVPPAAGLHFLGAICNTAIFPSRAPQDKILLTVFTGGVQQEHFFDEMGEEALQQQVLKELTSLLNIQQPPVLQRFSRWDKAIPQLNIGHQQVRAAVEGIERQYPGIYISGNYLCGVAVPAILQAAGATAERVK